MEQDEGGLRWELDCGRQCVLAAAGGGDGPSRHSEMVVAALFLLFFFIRLFFFLFTSDGDGSSGRLPVSGDRWQVFRAQVGRL